MICLRLNSFLIFIYNDFFQCPFSNWKTELQYSKAQVELILNRKSVGVKAWCIFCWTVFHNTKIHSNNVYAQMQHSSFRWLPLVEPLYIAITITKFEYGTINRYSRLSTFHTGFLRETQFVLIGRNCTPNCVLGGKNTSIFLSSHLLIFWIEESDY